MSAPGGAARKGRFAPSPTGPLHFGSVVAAVGSYLDARSSGAAWLLRIEDVDVPRCVPGAAEGILRTLERLGLEWDGPVLWQSSRTEVYRAALERLMAAGRVFGCICTRRALADARLARDGTRRYAGTCRDGLPPGRTARAFRLRVEPGCVRFVDRIQGPIEEDVAADVGDFVVLRADGYFAYQLAVVVDDAEAGITDVVRGADLLDSTPRQLLLQRALGLPQPAYAHVPVVTNGAGEKLSKQTLAQAVDGLAPGGVVADALRFLGHPPPAALGGAAPAELLAWAQGIWSLARVPCVRGAPMPGYG
ncbi:MAG TPA: tRNA glutamyl-Q(34) synthetase GluQRS [Zoogloea sp.]|uniref:tRNA glutamyl-Q(34) synthetase GluQRS n=1 Tax=Zoogloea sp. TaxID=49181 RepID=UPI002D195DFD|nr:tRNA glutamyl-Q(34) synthetase GluQRS [Zoogloea sp.]HMV17452.1 tRNA glutamyl-Q(34) synthetase GluQRS [Rhodocyclaceae bacterium]HMW51122.1 tRNA glutamyl-Q(34) synthetase GluQRS [Rhodocyclaceae bacterium]HNC79091.1 tRNA glutamyl-Q(34) synthetase GluQRS [Rhodocyclaceae bacterium]HND25020.1 tRNA glutamyl-Q(34) synthetase GluQRS [Rhodocyclaceae bacterium]HNE14874.1 tRNA glutamyl-Q(34) synthetase GluQRS [Rhodocyclaceae bacterium]